MQRLPSGRIVVEPPRRSQATQGRTIRPGGLGYIGRMKRTRFLLAALVLAACATAPTVDGADAQVEVDSHLLLGDIALERQDRDTAAREFLAAAMLSEEPGPGRARDAHRARARAHRARLDRGARWRELAPERRAAGLVPRRLRDARESRPSARSRSSTTFIRSIDDRRTGFALVLEALGDEPYTGTATAIMRSLNETFPNVPAGQYALARLALRSGDFELALDERRSRQQVERRLDRGAAPVRAHAARHGQDGRQPRDRRRARGPARRGRGAAPVRRAVALGGPAARSRDAAQRDPRATTRACPRPLARSRSSR